MLGVGDIPGQWGFLMFRSLTSFLSFFLILSLFSVHSQAASKTATIYKAYAATFTFPDEGEADPMIKTDFLVEYEANVCGKLQGTDFDLSHVILGDTKDVDVWVTVYYTPASGACTLQSFTKDMHIKANIKLQEGIKKYVMNVALAQGRIRWEFTKDDQGKWSYTSSGPGTTPPPVTPPPLNEKEKLKKEIEDKRVRFYQESKSFAICVFGMTDEDCLIGTDKMLSLSKSSLFPTDKFTAITIEKSFKDLAPSGFVQIDYSADVDTIKKHLEKQPDAMGPIRAKTKLATDGFQKDVSCGDLDFAQCEKGLDTMIEISKGAPFKMRPLSKIVIGKKFEVYSIQSDWIFVDYSANAETIKAYLSETSD